MQGSQSPYVAPHVAAHVAPQVRFHVAMDANPPTFNGVDEGDAAVSAEKRGRGLNGQPDQLDCWPFTQIAFAAMVMVLLIASLDTPWSAVEATYDLAPSTASSSAINSSDGTTADNRITTVASTFSPSTRASCLLFNTHAPDWDNSLTPSSLTCRAVYDQNQGQFVGWMPLCYPSMWTSSDPLACRATPWLILVTIALAIIVLAGLLVEHCTALATNRFTARKARLSSPQPSPGPRSCSSGLLACVVAMACCGMLHTALWAFSCHPNVVDSAAAMRSSAAVETRAWMSAYVWVMFGVFMAQFFVGIVFCTLRAHT